MRVHDVRLQPVDVDLVCVHFLGFDGSGLAEILSPLLGKVAVADVHQAPVAGILRADLVRVHDGRAQPAGVQVMDHE